MKSNLAGKIKIVVPVMTTWNKQKSEDFAYKH